MLTVKCSLSQLWGFGCKCLRGTRGIASACKNMYSDAVAARKHTGLHSETCPGLVCSPPSLRCAMRQCGSTVTAGCLFAGVKGKDVISQSPVHLRVKMLAIAGSVPRSLIDAICRLCLWLSTVIARLGYALSLFSLRSFVWPQIYIQRAITWKNRQRLIM